MIKGIRITKNFSLDSIGSRSSEKYLPILKGLSFEIPNQSWTSLVGPSGSGKSTLLSIMAGLDTPTSGSLVIDGISLETLTEEERALFRAKNMGFIFQSFRLLPTLTALENVLLPLEILGDFEGRSRGLELLKQVGLSERAHHLPSQLSGGEQQRVAVARAFVSKPRILFADEPTGNLDSKNGLTILNLLRELKTENESTLVVVTHDAEIAKLGDQILTLKDGQWVS